MSWVEISDIFTYGIFTTLALTFLPIAILPLTFLPLAFLPTFKEKGRKFLKLKKKKKKSAVGKGEIARYEQFLLFLQFFQKACSEKT